MVESKKILVITYYWPPSGGSGVQRWLKFVKYLPSFGVKPYVFTPLNPAFAIQDPSLLKDVPAEAEVIHFPIWEPYELFFRMSAAFGKKKSAKPTDLVRAKHTSPFQKISTWIRGNIFIPDPRVFWVKPSVKFLLRYLETNNIDTIITTGPPHSVHLIGLRLKEKRSTLRWIADFRDPWSDWGLLDSLKVGKIARRLHKKYEAKVLSTADEIITVTPFYAKRFEILSKRKIHLITNGFDEDDFKNVIITRPDKFTIRHIGIVNEKCDPRPFMEALHDLILNDPEFAMNVKLEFVGEVHPDFKHFVQSKDDLNSITGFMGNIPHKELIKIYGSSSLLLLVLTGYKDGEGFLPGKLFEYLATGLPVLGVGPKGDAGNVLAESGVGIMLEGDDHIEIINILKMHFQVWKDSIVNIKPSNNVNKYSRRNVTRQLSELLKKIN
jgi:glycosyltransferase involved in cell wall biosynthesis